MRHFVRRFICLIIATLLFPWFVSAQTRAFSWPPVTDEEKALKDDPLLPGAAAMILNFESHSDDEQRYQTVYIRYKVFTDAGRKYADVQIPFLNSTSFDVIKARTVNPDGTIIEFTGPVMEKLIVGDRRTSLNAKVFTIPAVATGSVFEYYYVKRWSDALPDPFRHPNEYVIDGAFSYSSTEWTVERDLSIRKLNFSVQPVNGAPLGFVFNHLPFKTRPIRSTTFAPSYRQTIKLSLQDVEGIPDETYMPPEDAVHGKVWFFYYLGAHSGNGFWSLTGKQYGEDGDKFVGRSNRIQAEAANVISPQDTFEEKVKKLYKRVQSIRNLSYEPTRTAQALKREQLRENKSAEEALRRGYLSGNEANLLFVAMLRSAGLEAYPVWLATRDSHVFNPAIWNTNSLNAMVVMARSGKQTLFLDPASKLCAFGLLPWEETGVQGLVASSAGGRWIDIPAPDSKDAVQRNEMRLKLLPDGTLSGTLAITWQGQEALQLKRDHVTEDDTGRRKTLADVLQTWLPGGSEIEITRMTGWEDPETPIVVEANIKAGGAVTLTKKLALLRVAVMHINDKNPFASPRRIYPVYFHYPAQMIDHLIVEVPKGWSASVPNPVSAKTEFSSFEQKCTQQGLTIECNRSLIMDGFALDISLYPQLRSFYEKVSTSGEAVTVLQVPDSNTN